MKIKFFYSPITGASAPILSKLTLALLFHLRWVDTLLNTMFTLRDLKEGKCKRSYKNVVAYQCSFTFQLPDHYSITARLAESFYNVKNGSSIITSKSSSKNLSNENKHTQCFQKIGILIHVLSWRQQKHQCLFSLLRFFEQLFDVIIDDPFLTL